MLWSPEVRGGEGEDMLRRMQAVCFSPLALFNGWATDTKLWTHAEVADHIRDAIRLRMRLLPYWYTAFAQYHVRGHAGRAPDAARRRLHDRTRSRNATRSLRHRRVVEIKDQYMVGDALLVAPIAPGAKTRKVVLPAGKWFDFYTGRLAGEGETIEVTPPLSQIPLFVKDGGLVPMIAATSVRPRPRTRCCRSRCGTTATTGQHAALRR